MLVTSLGPGTPADGYGRADKQLRQLVGRLAADSKLLSRSRPIDQLKREALDFLLQGAGAIGWAVLPGSAWRVPAAPGLGHLVHTLGKGGAWESRSISILQSESPAAHQSDEQA